MGKLNLNWICTRNFIDSQNSFELFLSQFEEFSSFSRPIIVIKNEEKLNFCGNEKLKKSLSKEFSSL